MIEKILIFAMICSLAIYAIPKYQKFSIENTWNMLEEFRKESTTIDELNKKKQDYIEKSIIYKTGFVLLILFGLFWR